MQSADCANQTKQKEVLPLVQLFVYFLSHSVGSVAGDRRYDDSEKASEVAENVCKNAATPYKFCSCESYP